MERYDIHLCEMCDSHSFLMIIYQNANEILSPPASWEKVMWFQAYKLMKKGVCKTNKSKF